MAERGGAKVEIVRTSGSTAEGPSDFARQLLEMQARRDLGIDTSAEAASGGGEGSGESEPMSEEVFAQRTAEHFNDGLAQIPDGLETEGTGDKATSDFAKQTDAAATDAARQSTREANVAAARQRLENHHAAVTPPATSDATSVAPAVPIKPPSTPAASEAASVASAPAAGEAQPVVPAASSVEATPVPAAAEPQPATPAAPEPALVAAAPTPTFKEELEEALQKARAGLVASQTTPFTMPPVPSPAVDHELMDALAHGAELTPNGTLVRPKTTVLTKDHAHDLANIENAGYTEAARLKAEARAKLKGMYEHNIERADTIRQDSQALLAEADELDAKAGRARKPERIQELRDAAAAKREEAQMLRRRALTVASLPVDTLPAGRSVIARGERQAAEAIAKAEAESKAFVGTPAEYGPDGSEISPAVPGAKEVLEGDYIRDPTIAEAAAYAERPVRKQIGRLDAIRPKPNEFNTRLVENHDKLVDSLRAVGAERAQNAADAEKQRLEAEAVVFNERFTKASNELSVLMDQESGALASPINGNESQATKLIDQIYTSYGINPTSEPNDVVMSGGFGRWGKYIDTYRYLDDKDSQLRGTVMVERYDRKTGKLIRFDVVKEPLAEGGPRRSERATKRAKERAEREWRQRIDVALAAERVEKYDDNIEVKADPGSRPKSAKEAYRGTLMAHGASAETSSSPSKKPRRRGWWANFFSA